MGSACQRSHTLPAACTMNPKRQVIANTRASRSQGLCSTWATVRSKDAPLPISVAAEAYRIRFAVAPGISYWCDAARLEEVGRAVLPREVIERGPDSTRVPDALLAQRLLLTRVMERGVGCGLREQLDLDGALEHHRGVAGLRHGRADHHHPVVPHEERSRLPERLRDRLAESRRAHEVARVDGRRHTRWPEVRALVRDRPKLEPSCHEGERELRMRVHDGTGIRPRAQDLGVDRILLVTARPAVEALAV